MNAIITEADVAVPKFPLSKFVGIEKTRKQKLKHLKGRPYWLILYSACYSNLTDIRKWRFLFSFTQGDFTCLSITAQNLISKISSDQIIQTISDHIRQTILKIA